MSNKQALLDCTFSWGRKCRLYRDSIEIAGRSYNLDDLTYIHPTYRTLFGISSARLELCFGLRRLILRGISDQEAARQMVSHLLPYVEQAGPATIAHRVRSRSTQARELARAQAKSWERTQKIPALPEVPRPDDSAVPADPSPEVTEERAPEAPAVVSSESADVFDDFLDLAEQPTSHIPTSALPVSISSDAESAQETLDPPAQNPVPEPDSALPLPEKPPSRLPMAPLSLPSKPILPGIKHTLPLLKLPSSPIPARPTVTAVTPAEPSLADAPSPSPADSPVQEKPSCPVPVVKMRPARFPRLEPPLRAVQLVSPDKKTLVPRSEPVSALTESTHPIIHVPVRLQPGEFAHYSIGAALCSDRLASSERAPYPPLDHGLLILTNRRIFYLGKRCQLILAYTHLWYVSLLHNAVALHIEGQFRRIILEIEHPREWANRIEQVAFNVRRSPSPMPTLVLPGIKAASTQPSTVKRVALKPLAAQEHAVSPPDSVPTPEPQQISKDSTPALVPQTEPGASEVATLATQAAPHIAEVTTAEFAPQTEPGISEVTTIEPAPQHQQSIAEVTTADFSPQTEASVAEAITADFSPPVVRHVVEVATLEFNPPAITAISEASTLEFTPDVESGISEISTLEFAGQEEQLTVCECSPLAEQDTAKTVALSSHAQSADAIPSEPPPLDEQDETEMPTLLLQDEIVTSKLVLLPVPPQSRAGHGKTRISWLYEKDEDEDEEVTGKLTAIDADIQAEREDTRPLWPVGQEEEDETTVPLRQRNIAVLNTHPLRDTNNSIEKTKKARRTSRSRLLSRTRFLQQES